MAATKPAGSGRGALPAELTSFVGRRRELKETRRLLASSRMLTLTGVGGVGKTRLALRMAAEVRRTFPGGVWFVELAAVHDPQLVPHTVANTLELRQVSADPAATWRRTSKGQQLLVVLDNCEHLTDACAVLASKLLAAAPGLRILATSRHVLGVEGEQILSVPPLSHPGLGGSTAGDATHYESVTLFLERASAVAPGFEITDGNRAAVVELCRRLDGIPLAIELAAVWLRILSPAQVLDRLEDRFRLLTSGRPAAPARQQALDATVGWSYDLCSPAEQLMWARLSVFAGGFDLDAAEYVCSNHVIDRDEVLGLIASLVNKSIIVRHQATQHTPPGTTCSRRSGSTARSGSPTRSRCARCRSGTATTTGRWPDSSQPRASDPTRPTGSCGCGASRQHPGGPGVLPRATRARPSAAYDIAAQIWNFWFAGFLREGYRYLTRALDLATEQTAARAHGLWAASYLAMFATDFERNAEMLAECDEIAAGLDDPLLLARIKECRGQATLYQGDLPGAIDLLEQARREFQALGNALGEFDTLILLTACTFFLEDPRDDTFSQQALELAERHGAQSSTAYALWARRHRALASRRLRPGDGVVATVRAALPADARPDRHQLRRAGAVVVRRVRRAR